MPGPTPITRWSRSQADEYCCFVDMAQHYCDQGLLLMSPLMVLICCSCCGCWARESGERDGGWCCWFQERGCLVECGSALGLLCWNLCGRCACGERFRQRCCACCAGREERRRTRTAIRTALAADRRRRREADELFGALPFFDRPLQEKFQV
jgi:hypothetical protein